MTNKISDAMTAARTNHAEPSFDARDIDHSTEQPVARVYNPQRGNKLSETIIVTRGIGEGEEPDFAAAAEAEDEAGTARENGKLHTGTGSKAKTPFWFYNDFYWKNSVNQATGEVSWYVAINTDVVLQNIAYGPMAMQNAYASLSDDDKKAATELGMAIRDASVLASNIDGWLENTAAYAYMREAAKNIARAVKFTLASEGQKGDERRENLEEMAESAGRNAAILKLALITAAPTLEMNYKAGAWEVYKMEALKHQKAFMNPDEQKLLDEAAEAANHNRTTGLLRSA